MVKIATDYATSAQVAAFMHRGSDFDTNSTPTQSEVQDRINEIEDYIDNYTHMAWRTTSISNEYHDIPDDFYNWHYNTGYPIYLKQSNVVLTTGPVLDTSEGDKLEVWDGSSWVDWTSTKTEGRGDDYWVEPDRGVLWINSRYNERKHRSVRLTYRYGKGTVPKDIRRACILLVAADLILMDDRQSVSVPTGGDMPVSPLEQRASSWRRQAKEILERHTGPMILL